MIKPKASNDGAVDMYLTNSDKPADNNVLTGRLPVSTGPQHHHQQQQLMMHTDDVSRTLFANYPA